MRDSSSRSKHRERVFFLLKTLGIVTKVSGRETYLMEKDSKTGLNLALCPLTRGST